MSCHDPAAALVAWYANGTLEAGRRVELEQHLQRCDACRASLAIARGIVRHAEQDELESLDGHVQSELLTEFALRPSTLEDHVRRRVATHLASCEPCASAESIVREMEADLAGEASEDRPTAREESAWSRIWRGLGATLLRPELALVYLLVVVVSVPLYRELLAPGPVSVPPATATPTAGSIEIRFLAATTRGEGPVTRVPLGERQPSVYLGIEPELPADVGDESPFDVEVVRDGSVVWTHRATAGEIRRSLRSDQLALVLAVPAELVPPGRYTLRLRAAGSKLSLLEHAFETVRTLSSDDDARIEGGGACG